MMSLTVLLKNSACHFSIALRMSPSVINPTILPSSTDTPSPNLPLFPLLPHYPQGDEIEIFGKLVSHTLVAGTAYTRESGEAELQKGIASLIAYGSLFLANPDLPRRFEQNAALNAPDRPTLFGGGEHGYIDYPFLPA